MFPSITSLIYGGIRSIAITAATMIFVCSTGWLTFKFGFKKKRNQMKALVDEVKEITRNEKEILDFLRKKV